MHQSPAVFRSLRLPDARPSVTRPLVSPADGTRRFRFRRRACAALALLLATALPGLSIGEAAAQSKREREVNALQTRLSVAEARYREALVRIGNNDPEGIVESNAALEDMEDVIDACLKLKGCPVSQMIAGYKRLLKADVDARIAARDGEVEEDGEDLGDLPTGRVPRGAQAAALLADDGERFKRMVQMNPAVQAGIRRWLTDMRVSLIQSHENYQYMRHLMSPAFQRSGLPEALLFGIMAKESTGRVHVGSRAGAVGPLQFMPATGRRFGLGPDGTGFDTRYDPRMSADAAASYLNERYAEFGNNIEMWLAAYNGGEGRALRVYRGSGGRSFWESDVYGQFPAETRDYVPMVIAAAWIYLHPKEYGLSFPKVDARPASIRLARMASIYELTICLGNGNTRDGYMRVLRNLNPRYEAEDWIPAGTVLNGTVKMAALYEKYCVQGDRAQTANLLVNSDPRSAILPPVRTAMLEGEDGTVPATDAAPPSAPKASARNHPRRHKVSRGDTLMSIARRYSCDLRDLAQANRLKAPKYSVRLGQQIELKGCGG